MVHSHSGLHGALHFPCWSAAGVMAQWGQIQAQGAASLPRHQRSEREAVRGILRGHVPCFPGVLRALLLSARLRPGKSRIIN